MYKYYIILTYLIICLLISFIMYFKFKNCNIIEFYEGNRFRAGGCKTCEDGKIVNQDKSGCISSLIIVACGGNHTMFLTNQGKVYGCGSNEYYQVISTNGGNSDSKIQRPTQVTEFDNLLVGDEITQIACGWAYTMFLTNTGNVYGCGSNAYYQVISTNGGEWNSKIQRPSRVTEFNPELESSDKITQIACGGYNTMFLTNTGKVYGCGLNNVYQINSSLTDPITQPTKITDFPELESGDKITQIACGSAHTMFLTSLGKVYGCGYNQYYQVNSTEGGEWNSKIQTPTEITNFPELESGDKITQIACGSAHTMFLTNTGKVYGCGWNKYFQVNSTGDAYQNSVIQTPTEITDFPELDSSDKIIEIACGYGHTMFLTEKGKVYGCGSNTYYQVNSTGNGDLISRIQTPTEITNFPELDGSKKIKKISCGNYHTIFSLSYKKFYGCGNNDYNQISENYDNTITFYNETYNVVQNKNLITIPT